MSTVKCLVWDLDNTLWDGILLEDVDVKLRRDSLDTIRELDSRGILHSVASRNDPDTAFAKLAELGVDEYFLYPQIGWGAKSESVRTVAETLNIGIDTLAFVDDDPFDRDEVSYAHPHIRTFDATDVASLPDLADFVPPFVTPESAQRRAMYKADEVRSRAESDFAGPPEEFLATLQMVFTISPAATEDLQRAEELTVRTNQLNTTGRTYTYDQLDAFSRSEDHLLLVASLQDRFGTYGKIGLSLVDGSADPWTLKLLLMSCRVLSRGVGSVLLHHVMRLARDAGVGLRAELVPNERNRMMLVTLRFAGFKEAERDGELSLLEADLSRTADPPPYVEVRT